MRYAYTMDAGAMEAAFVVVLGLVAATHRLTRILSSSRPVRSPEPPDASDPRWRESGGAQIIGRSCVECNFRIAVELEGRFCRACGVAVHRRQCARKHKALAHPVGGHLPYR